MLEFRNKKLQKIMTELQKMKKYLGIYKKNPKSKVFVPLSELYRKRGDVDKALKLCQKGLEFHPQLSAGYIAQALVLLDMNKLERASHVLEKTTQISPENILAYKLLGQCYLKLKNPLKTLSAYKMLLFLDPNNKTAQKIVKKLEPATAAQYDETGFCFKNLKDIAQHLEQNQVEQIESLSPLNHKADKQFQARLSVISALIYRNNFKKAEQFLMEMKILYPKQAQALKKWERLLPVNSLTNFPHTTGTKSALQGAKPLTVFLNKQVEEEQLKPLQEPAPGSNQMSVAKQRPKKLRQKKIQNFKHKLSLLEKTLRERNIRRD